MVIAVRHRDIVAAASPVDAPPHVQCGLDGLRGLTHAELKPLEQVRVERAPQLRPAAARAIGCLEADGTLAWWHTSTGANLQPSCPHGSTLQATLSQAPS